MTASMSKSRQRHSAPIIIHEDDSEPRRSTAGMILEDHSEPRRRTTMVIHEDDSSSSKIVPRGKSNFRRCASVPMTLFDLASIMKRRTLDESLHSKYGSEGSRNGDRALQFDRIMIREYARTVGDNPSCSSGPPVSISWEYNAVGDIGLEDYEKTRPPRRTHFEMVLPRKVRQDMLRRDWDVAQSAIAESVRRNVKVKNQRKATVNNLNKATKMEEAMESASRKIKRILTLQKPVSAQVRDLEAQLDLAERMRNKLRAQMRLSQSLDERHDVPEVVDTSTASSK